MQQKKNSFRYIWGWLVVLTAGLLLYRSFAALNLDHTRYYLLFVAGGVLAEMLAVPFPLGRVSGSTALFLAVALIYGLPAAWWVGFMATLLGQGIFNRGDSLRTVLFNAAQQVLSLAAGGLALGLTAGLAVDGVLAASRPLWRVVAGLSAFILAQQAANHLLVYLYGAPAGRSRRYCTWRDALRWDVLVCLFAFPFGLVLALVYRQTSPLAGLALFIPVLVMQRLMGLYLGAEMTSREMAVFYRVVRRLAAAPASTETAGLLLQEIGQLVPYQTGVVYLLDEPGEHYTAVAVQGAWQKQFTGTALRDSGDFLEQALRDGRAEIIFDTRSDPRLVRRSGLTSACRSLLLAPLSVDGRPVGLVVLGHRQPLFFDQRELQLVSLLAGQASQALTLSFLRYNLEKSRRTDRLTGLLNGPAFQEQAVRWLEEAREKQQEVLLLRLDIDGLATLNNRFGYPAGDRALAGTAAVLEMLRPPGTLAGRAGGGEFWLLWPDPPAGEVRPWIHSLQAAVREQVLVEEGIPGQVRLSAGGALFPATAGDLVSLIKVAGRALEEAQKHPRERVVIRE
ncbi:MAG: diguanylate cyclase domain-containing protein [Desulfurispora sp.]|uniref:diguanylate cyclase domain-containing protein n=1 Tax=Desulfurispora sp. TaxID=3014275 RepID=UPI0040496943